MAVFRPDADPETNSVDGFAGAYISGDGGSWAEIEAHAGGESSEATDTAYVLIRATSVTNKWKELIRGITLFYTASLPDDIAISGATLSLYGLAKKDDLSINPSINVYACDPASNTDIIPADYTTFSNTPLSSAISYASWDDNGWNDFTLNASGRALISKTGVTKLGLRESKYDAGSSTPAWVSNKQSYFYWYTADYSDGSFAPKLTITYTTSTMTAGNFAVVETRLHYVGTDSVERYIYGPIIGDGVNAAGNVAVVENRLQYIGVSYTKERYWMGTLIGDATNPVGNIAVVENRLHYTDTSSKERYVKGVPV